GENFWQAVIKYVQDSPRISFENNPDENNQVVAEANLTMRIMGGISIDLHSGTDGQTQVSSIKSYDPLDHPRLEAERVLIKDIQGSVNSNGKVVLDLGRAESQRYPWELTGSRIKHERRVGGAFLKRMFRQADPERRTYVLGEVAQSDQTFLEPERFSLRTVMEEGANVKDAPNEGAGALEIRIAMKGKPTGGFPGQDWFHCIPRGLPGVNASLMISNEMIT
ncbi:hypothetical protein, partial [Pseudomonas sp. SDO55104_S430]